MITVPTKTLTAALLAATMLAPALPMTQIANADERATASSLKKMHPTVARTVQRAMPKIAAERGKGPLADEKSDIEMFLTCGEDWFVFWVEDKDGNPIMGTITVHCNGDDIPAG